MFKFLKMFETLRVKNTISLIIDLIIASVVALLGLYLRFSNEITWYSEATLIRQEFIFTFSALVSNILFNLYKDIWRYFNQEDLIKHFRYATLTIAIFTTLLFLNSRLESFPRSVIFIDWMLLILLTMIPKIAYKIYTESSFKNLFNKSISAPNLLLIIGISRSVERYIEELKRMQSPPYKIVGILDKKQNIKRVFHGVPVIDEIKNFKSVIEVLISQGKKPDRMIIGSEIILTNMLQKLIIFSSKYSIPISRLPNLMEITNNIGVKNKLMKPIAIEDLLMRSQKDLDLKSIKSMIEDKSIMITGAGGSIGSELVKQCATFNAKNIILLDNSEFLLYEIEQQCLQDFPQTHINPKLIDIQNYHEVEALFKNFNIDIVFHAAALKHVPLVEKHRLKAISINIFGTLNIVKLAIEHKVARIVFISTDKAVDPMSFMGATKKVAEILCRSLASKSTKIDIVRFGNVLGSNGSVVPLFEKQIEAGGPVKVTHAEVTRYFMSISEAVGLVLQASAIKSHKVKYSQTFVLDMGQPVKILDLATQMIILAGLKPYVDIKIKFIGLRPGEKLHEILISENDKLKKTVFKDIHVARSIGLNKDQLTALLNELKDFLLARNEDACLKTIKQILNN